MPRRNSRLKFVNCYRDRHGKERCWYRRDGQRIPIKGDFGTPEFLKSYQAIQASFEAPAAAGRGAIDGTFQAAVLEYFESDRFRHVKPQTQYGYRNALKPLLEAFGHVKLAKITRGGLVQLRDNIARKQSPRKAIEAIKVLNLVFETARDRDMITTNPAKDIAKPAGYKATPHRPWTQDELDLFLENAKPVWRRSVTVLLYTGLRRDDAIKLTRDRIRGNRIYLTEETGGGTQKTGSEVIIPIHDRLKAELARPMRIANAAGLLITGTRGRPIRGDVLSASIRRECQRLGIEDPPPLHGLRKNAVRRLVELGVAYQDIQAITGQSIEMIKHYSRGYDRERAVERVEAVIELSMAGKDKNKS
ncbi:MAG: tyrosine-type recombinase/integrase [Alphaproteobacteria bacterium]